MPSITLHENVVTEVAPAIAIKDPGRGVWVIDLGAAVPLSHLCREDVQIPVAIDIAHVQRVAMYHVAAQQITSHPRVRPGGVSFAFINLQRTSAVAWRDDDLGVFTWFEVSRPDAAAYSANWNGSELAAALVFEPRIPSKQIEATVAIHIERINAFGIFGSIIVRLTSIPGEDCFERPLRVRPGIRRNLGEVRRFRSLIPEG